MVSTHLRFAHTRFFVVVVNQHDMNAIYTYAIAPGKRPLSSMTPTFVLKDGDIYLVVGASGGSRIINGVIQVLRALSYNDR